MAGTPVPARSSARAPLREARDTPFAVVIAPARPEHDPTPLLRALAGQTELERKPVPVFAALGRRCAAAAARLVAVGESALEVTLLREEECAAGAGRVLGAAAMELERRAGEADPVLLVIHPEAVPAPDWVAGNLRALAAGADLVCGVAAPALRPEAGRLPPTIEAIVRYRRLVARLEEVLDPLPWDPAPRHGDESGLSLALRLSTFRAAGGVPDVPELAQRHLVLRARQAGAAVRHCPQVRVSVPAYHLAAGEADGFLPDGDLPVRVPDPEVLEAALQHRARQRAALRPHYARLPRPERDRAIRAHLALTGGNLLAARRTAPVERACRQLRERLEQLGVPWQAPVVGKAPEKAPCGTRERSLL